MAENEPITEEPAVAVSSPRPAVSSPPPAPAPERVEPDPRERVRQLAAAVARTNDRRLLAEYLRARRAVR